MSLASSLTAAAATTAGLARLATDQHVLSRTAGWTRPNYQGRTVTLLEGPAAVAGLLVGLVADRQAPAGSRAAVAIAAAVAGAVGMYDDRSKAEQAKGFRGHFSALANGRVTGGLVKVVGVGLGAVTAAAVLSAGRHRGEGRPGWPTRLADTGLDAVLIAASANLVNLLDLRPGRAVKAAALLSTAGLASGGAAVLGAAAGAAPVDLAARGMLGDCGANALGAAAGATLAGTLPRPPRLVLAGALVWLNLASERVSFTAVIQRTGWLRRLDRLGGRP